MKYLSIVLLLMLSGCGGMTYEETQEYVAYCKLNGLEPIYITRNAEIMFIECRDANGRIFPSKKITKEK